eukprot:Rmarinus@m.2801
MKGPMAEFFSKLTGLYDQIEDDEPVDFDALSINESLGGVERLEVYCRSEYPLQRSVHVMNFVNFIRDDPMKPPENFERISKVLEYIVTMESQTEIKEHLCNQLPLVAEFYISEYGDLGYNEVVETILGSLQSLVCDKSSQEVKLAAGFALLKVAQMLKREHVDSPILTTILNFAHDEEDDHRTVAAHLLSRLSPVLGVDRCCQFAVPELSSLAQDPVFVVRKAVASNISGVLTVLKGEAQPHFDRLLDAFVHLSRDKIWGVRKACAQAIVSVSECCTEEVRHERLTNIMMRMLEDVSRWVRNGAFEYLGPFIATIQKENVSPELLRHFATMGTTRGKSDSDMAWFCAYNFPAVVQTVGPEQWHELQPAYANLVSDMQWKVRRSLAHSLHEVAKVLPAESTERDLLPAFRTFFQDMENVKVGVLVNLAKFLECLSIGARADFLPLLLEFRSPDVNWRFREVIATQLHTLATLFDKNMSYSTIWPLYQALVHDPMAIVRTEAVRGTGAVLRGIGITHRNPDLPEIDEIEKERRVEALETLKDEDSWWGRQMRVRFYAAWWEDAKVAGSVSATADAETDSKPVYVDDVVELALDLVEDPVTNVRMMLAKVFPSAVDLVSGGLQARVVGAVEKLLYDAARDVRDAALHGILDSGADILQPLADELMNSSSEGSVHGDLANGLPEPALGAGGDTADVSNAGLEVGVGVTAEAAGGDAGGDASVGVEVGVEPSSPGGSAREGGVNAPEALQGDGGAVPDATASDRADESGSRGGSGSGSGSGSGVPNGGGVRIEEVVVG